MLTIECTDAQLTDLQVQIVELFESAFPVAERRPTAHLLRNIGNGTCKCFVAFCYGKFAGFLVAWNFDDFAYVEYLATTPQLRGQQIGSRLIKHAISHFNKPIVLEVEPPTDETTRRRIAFYKRAGFVLCEKPYIQPAYGCYTPPVPLKLMEHGGTLTQEQFEHVVQQLHRHVYNVKEY